MSKKILVLCMVLLIALCCCVLWACCETDDLLGDVTTESVGEEVLASLKTRGSLEDAGISGTVITCTVETDVTSLDFSTLAIKDGTIVVYADEAHETVLSTVTLADGENVFYVTASKGDIEVSYTLKVTRKAPQGNEEDPEQGNENSQGSEGGETGNGDGNGDENGEGNGEGNEEGDPTTDPTIDPPAHEHTFEEKWTSDETYHWHAATCGHIDEVKDKAAHIWNGGEITTPATEKAEGVKTYTCTVCGATKEESIEKLAHEHTFEEKWTSDETYHWHAATCGHTTEVKDKAAHTWNDGEITTPATLKAEGVRTYTCTVCGAINAESIERLTSSEGLAYVLKEDDDTYEVMGIGTCADTEIVIAALYNGKAVTSIGESAFNNCNSFTSITLPASITGIGENAFYGCSLLTSIDYRGDIAGWCALSEKIMSSSRAFRIQGEEPKGDLEIPDGVKRIGAYAFFNCKELTSVMIPKSVTSIGELAFNGCSSLEEMTIPFVGKSSVQTETSSEQYPFGYIFGSSHYKGATAISQSFYKLSSKELTRETYYIPSSLRRVTVTGKKILRGAFENCSKLTAITIPETATNIGASSFSGCSELAAIEIPDTVKSIGERAFENCVSLRSVIFSDGNNLTSIEKYAFSGCIRLDSIVIPEGVTSIGSSAFYTSRMLTTVTLPYTLTDIGSYAFYGCDKLIEVWNKSDLVISKGSSNYGYIGYYAKNVYKSAGGSKLSRNDIGYLLYTDGELISLVRYNGSDTKHSILEGITQIEIYAFAEHDELTSITIPSTVTSIGYGAFSGCSSLEEMTIPFIGAEANKTEGDFYRYPFGHILGGLNYTDSMAVEQFYYSNSTSPIKATYYLPASLRKVTVTGGQVLSYAFNNCSMLTSVTIVNNVTSIGDAAFRGCSALSSLEIPSSVTSIGKLALSECVSLKCNEYDNALYLGNEENPYFILVRAKDKAITSCEISPYTKIIYMQAFFDCGDLTAISIPGSVISIGSGAFEQSGLTSIEIPNSITIIESEVFRNCANLNSITIPETVTSIGSYAFGSCDVLESVIVPDSVTSLGDHAFGYCDNLTTVTIGSGVTTIGIGAFTNCGKLKTVTMGGSVKSLDRGVFYYCTSLSSIIFHGTSAEWNSITKGANWDYNTGYYTIHYEA